MRTGILTALSAFGLATLTQAQVPRAAGMTSDSFCSTAGDFCVTGLYLPERQAINYTLVVAQTGQYGWTGIGQGTQMSGANILVTWPNADGSVTTSHRSAPGEVMPTEARVSAQQAQGFERNAAQSVQTQQHTISSWLFGQAEAPGTIDHIFAYAGAAKAPASADSAATIRYHDSRGFFTLDLTKEYTGAAPAGLAGGQGASTGDGGAGTAGYGPAQRDLSNKTTQIWFAHMMFMVLGWMLLVPLGAFIGRFGRTMFKWFPYHSAVQSLAVVFVIIGFALGVYNYRQRGTPQWTLLHHKLGLALFILILIQAILGATTHEIRKRTGFRWIGFFHIFNGVVMFGLAVWNISEGFKLWTWQPGNAPRIVIWVWAGVVGVVYLAGLALVPREIRQDKERKETASRGEKGSDEHLTHNPSPSQAA
ncbi:Predicted membrane protein, contains DoH and Cytochrome b-561/ferric reductase transmembrane domains [Ceraceosorus bombacis]|uniref:Predicted membrane protein, contains DoH and Cytochrome b-561/ferric reductase transmembrane domains n=1 Tax=Ceraceosorus bombacis TaxID=401625 RepID=A0A0P1BNH9_9BASI|nr:Predicted membrane protein, contains DoH and Cytochrome b-561/ferric reductase transmembrane domains [Ceraceosorus bombacis]